MTSVLRVLRSIRRARRQATCLALSCAIGLLVAGCQSTGHDKKATKRPLVDTTSKGPQVDVSGKAMALGETTAPAIAPERLRQIVSRLSTAGRRYSAMRWVRRYPDIALTSLRQPFLDVGRSAGDASTQSLIAQVFHEQCAASSLGLSQVGADGDSGRTHVANISASATTQGWPAAIRDRATRLGAYRAYDRARSALLQNLAAGRLKEAADTSLSEVLPADAPAAYHIDATRLQGAAALLAERESEAVKQFSEAVNWCGDANPFERSRALLLLSNAQRRAGDRAGAVQSWTDAVSTEAKLMGTPRLVRDPVFWERAVYLRPSKHAWPGAVLQELTATSAELAGDGFAPIHASALSDGRKPVPSVAATAADAEAIVWTSIGHIRLHRQQPQAGLVALRRAEVLVRRDDFRSHLRLHQARALAQLNQQSAATAILIGLASQKTSAGRAALALIGVMEVERGNAKRGLMTLKRSLDMPLEAPWPGRTQAEADLGLAYLIVGNEDAGLRWLHGAQERFARGDKEQLIKSLRNEARYFEATNKRDRAAAIAERIRGLEQG